MSMLLIVLQVIDGNVALFNEPFLFHYGMLI